MKTFHIAFVAACLIACAYTYPSQPNNEEDDLDNLYNFSFPIIPDFSGLFSDAMRSMNHMRQNFLNYFWNMPDFTNIPKGANTTSTVKIIDGHKVTINETTYVSNDTDSNVAFIIRTIDVQPEDAILNNTGPTTVKAEAPGSREEVDLNNEISKNTDDLSA